MAQRLTHEESRAIKRTMRATPRISQRMHDGWFGDDGRFVIWAGKPPIGQLLEAKKSDVGKWSVEVVDIWEGEVAGTGGRARDVRSKSTLMSSGDRRRLRPTVPGATFARAMLRILKFARLR